jgi:hypothetical protein
LAEQRYLSPLSLEDNILPSRHRGPSSVLAAKATNGDRLVTANLSGAAYGGQPLKSNDAVHKSVLTTRNLSVRQYGPSATMGFKLPEMHPLSPTGPMQSNPFFLTQHHWLSMQDIAFTKAWLCLTHLECRTISDDAP